MRGDEAQEIAGGGEAARGRGGPRHAAPRKSLLTKLHMPAGKALALAAMPTAVFVGMSLTPKLAMAAEEPVNPFAPGPCVTQPDEAAKDADKDGDGKPDTAKDEAAKDQADKDGAAKDEADKGKDGAGEPDATKPDATKPGGATDDAAKDDPAKDDAAGDGAGAGAQDGKPPPDATKSPAQPKAPGAEAQTPAPTPTPTESKNPLDPLGVGPAIKDFFDGLGGKKEEPAAPPAATPTPKDSAAPDAKDKPADDAQKPPAADPGDAGAAGADKADDAKDAKAGDAKADDAKDAKAEDAKADDAKAALDKKAKEAKEKLAQEEQAAKDKADAATAKTEKAIREAAEKLGLKVEDFDRDGDGKPDLVPNADGQIPFPCPTADPKALADAELEPGIPDLPDDPWILETSMLTLRGLNYEGVVEVRTAGGKIKKVLKFTTKETDIKDLHQTTVGPNGTTGHVQARKGSTSTLRQGTVTMYTEELKGNLFGLIPITFSPESPPPLNVPIAMFTKVRVVQAGQFGGTLTVPGLHNYFTGPGTGNAAAN
ncbi:hypothetical protein ACIQM4_05050 [Streptomyces sp. NPDC091272]|uniref:hypothetical protein n=1 Tax=Streptomyces sp. NPDC091272 TaxID=3365981 RepID=UPI00381913A1